MTRKKYTNIKQILVLLIGCALLTSCTKSYKMTLADPIKHGGEMWRGYFVANNGKHIPFSMGIKEEPRIIADVPNLHGKILSGYNCYSSYIITIGDSLKIKSGLHSYLSAQRKGDKIEGIFMDGVKTQKPKAPFILIKNGPQAFKQEKNSTNIAFTGSWNLDFGALKDLSDTAELLRYNIDRARVLDLYKEDDLVLGKTYIDGAGTQGFYGKATKNGFQCTSYHHSEPFLIEATFIDENHFEAVITSITDSYKVKGSRASTSVVNIEHSASVIQGFLLYIKSVFKL